MAHETPTWHLYLPLKFSKCIVSHCSDIETKVQGSKWKVSEKFAWMSGSSDRQLLQFLEIITKTCPCNIKRFFTAVKKSILS